MKLSRIGVIDLFKTAVILFIFLIDFRLFAQKYEYSYTDEKIENHIKSYTSKKNVHYWKNRKPTSGYWQQDVHYQIDATLLDSINVLEGKMKLIYKNNSPDSLDRVFFHLYQNVGLPGSYAEKLFKANGVKPKYGPYAKEGLGIEVKNIFINGKEYLGELDNTILQIKLKNKLSPDSTLKISLDFSTYVENHTLRRRLKHFSHKNNKHYDMVHWYPRIAVYDAKFGWNTDQHLGKEFYGDYGTYDVKINLPSEYVNEATGILVNEFEVMPTELKKQLNISNYKSKVIKYSDATYLKYLNNNTKRKTWHYYAENVHDFSFTCDPSYRIAEKEVNGIKLVILAMEENAWGWQKTMNFLEDVVSLYEKDFGAYIHPKLVVADANDGMEYQMMALCGGISPSNHGLIAHEVGHQWFQGMVGNNETYRAFLDEGFTQFLTFWSMEAIYGKERWNTYKIGDLIVSDTFRYRERMYDAYFRLSTSGEKYTLNTHSDDFNGALNHGGGYGGVYHKTAVMLYNLEYILGKDLFLKAMQNYFKQWYNAHPYPEDFRNSVIRFTKVDLNWFFDQWLETDKYIDYKLKGLDVVSDCQLYKLKIKRLGTMHSPLMVTVQLESGNKKTFYIPNNWYVPEGDFTVLPRWIGWGKMNRTYTADIEVLEKPVSVFIDTSYSLADIDYSNNGKGKDVFQLRTEIPYHQPKDFKTYKTYWRPDFYYNAVDGVKMGIAMKGDYYGYVNKFEGNVWYNSTLGSYIEHTTDTQRNIFDYRIKYETPFKKINPDNKILLEARNLDGYRLVNIATAFRVNKKSTLQMGWKIFDRPLGRHLDYLIYNDLWDTAKINSTLNLKYDFATSWGSNNLFATVKLRNSTFFSDYQYQKAEVELKYNKSYKRITWKNRVYGALLITENTAPKESQIYISGANHEELMDINSRRSRGLFPENWLTPNSNYLLQEGGGLNIRGIVGFMNPSQDASLFGIDGNRMGISYSSELEFGNLIPKVSKKLNRYYSLTPYLFYDAAILRHNNENFTEVANGFMDAGLGFYSHIHHIGKFNNIPKLTLRTDFPIYVAQDSENPIALRVVIGVNRSF